MRRSRAGRRVNSYRLPGLAAARRPGPLAARVSLAFRRDALGRRLDAGAKRINAEHVAGDGINLSPFARGTLRLVRGKCGPGAERRTQQHRNYDLMSVHG
jgi:hypothetical protein